MAQGLRTLSTVWGVLVTVRFSLVFTVVFLAAMLLAGQAKDLLWLAAEKGWGWSGALSLYVAVGVYAVNAWYWARISLYARIIVPEQRTPVADWLETHLPRLLGTLPFLALAIALNSAAGRPAADLDTDTAQQLKSMGQVAALLGGAFYGWTIARRMLLTRMKGIDWQADRAMRTAALAERPCCTVLPWSSLPPLTRRLMLLFLPAFLAVVVLTVVMPVTFGRFWGTAPLFLVWGAGFVAAGSAISYVSSRTGLPIILGGLGLALVLGYTGVNANHRMRVTDAPDGPAPDAAQAAFARWFADRAEEIAAADPRNPYPVVIVASAGGGIRAAFWTTYLLARLEDERPGFSRHVLGLSGVSGGSVGIAAFASDVRLGPVRQGSATRRMVDYYQAEFLSPLLTGFLIPDLAQRFIPFPVMAGGNPLLDRARGFELGLETSPGAMAGIMGRSVASLYPAGDTSVPFLFFNATTVQAGDHAIISPVRLNANQFPAVRDLSCLAQRVRVSTAAHTSARFPYLSPAGEVESWMGAGCQPEPPAGYDFLYVDGGYFDNSGTVTAKGIGKTAILAFEQMNRDRQAAGRPRIATNRIRLVFVYIANDPEMAPLDTRPAFAPLPATPPSTALQDLTAPLLTIVNIRGALQQEQLLRFVREVRSGSLDGLTLPGADNRMSFHLLRLPRTVTDLPLGWVLSDLSKQEIRQSIDGCPDTALPDDVPPPDAPHITPDPVTCDSFDALKAMLPGR